MSSMSLTDLETAVAYLYSVFESHKEDDGRLSRDSFIDLLNKELPSFTKGRCPYDIFDNVDLDEDGHVDFKEFATLVALYASRYQEVLATVVALYKS